MRDWLRLFHAKNCSSVARACSKPQHIWQWGIDRGIAYCRSADRRLISIGARLRDSNPHRSSQLQSVVDLDDVSRASRSIQRRYQVHATSQHGALIDRALIGDLAVIEGRCRRQ